MNGWQWLKMSNLKTQPEEETMNMFVHSAQFSIISLLASYK